MNYILYVDGQLGLPFDNADDARAAAQSFQQEGFDTFIVQLDDDEPTSQSDAP